MSLGIEYKLWRKWKSVCNFLFAGKAETARDLLFLPSSIFYRRSFFLCFSCIIHVLYLNAPGDKSARTKYQTESVPDFGLEVIPPTCFADPVYVAVEFPLQLLLTAKFQEGLPILDPLPLLGEFSATLKDERISAKKCPCPLSRFLRGL